MKGCLNLSSFGGKKRPLHPLRADGRPPGAASSSSSIPVYGGHAGDGARAGPDRKGNAASEEKRGWNSVCLGPVVFCVRQGFSEA